MRCFWGVDRNRQSGTCGWNGAVGKSGDCRWPVPSRVASRVACQNRHRAVYTLQTCSRRRLCVGRLASRFSPLSTARAPARGAGSASFGVGWPHAAQPGAMTCEGSARSLSCSGGGQYHRIGCRARAHRGSGSVPPKPACGGGFARVPHARGLRAATLRCRCRRLSESCHSPGRQECRCAGRRFTDRGRTPDLRCAFWRRIRVRPCCSRKAPQALSRQSHDHRRQRRTHCRHCHGARNGRGLCRGG